jgi:ribose transport system substrate-binding protein
VTWIKPRMGAVATSGFVALAVALAACGSQSNGTQSSDNQSGSVKVSEGNATVTIPKSHMKLGLFMNASANQWQEQFILGAQAAAKKAGDPLTILNANFTVPTQVSQIINAATSHSFNAAVVNPIDGNAICTETSQMLAKANILISVAANPICGHAGAATGSGMWAPGTLNFVGGDDNYPYVEAFIKDAGALNPGKQNVLAVVGPTTGSATIAEKKAFNGYAAAHPNFHINGYLYTDYTTPTAYTDTLDYLKAHPQTTLILSIYSPDMTKGVLQAMTALGDLKKIKVDDEGGSSYSVQQVKDGNLQFTLPYFPYYQAYQAVESLISAQQGGTPPRFVPDVPPSNGTVYKPLVITQNNAGSFHPQY